MKEKWISVIRKDGEEVRFKTDKIYSIKLGSDEISVFVGNIGWKDEFWFGLPDRYHKTVEEGAADGLIILTKEELEKLRTELQKITEEIE